MRSNLTLNVYYGPRSRAADYLSLPEDFITVTEFVERTDTNVVERVEAAKKAIKQVNIVGYADEFHAVSESFIDSFWRRLDGTTLKNAYLVNPPQQILRQAHSNGIHIVKKSFEHKDVDREIIKTISASLDKHVVGQSAAKKQIIKSLIPLLGKGRQAPVVLMFLGPAGVGKTESALRIADALGGKPVRSQLSMMRSNAVSEYLYGGKSNERSFALDLLERETNVLLLDEFDKTSDFFHGAFYQLFDEGIFEDKNHHVNLERSIIICTSNYESHQQAKDHIGSALYSRITMFIPFTTLSLEEKSEIASQVIMKIQPQMEAVYGKDCPTKEVIMEKCKKSIEFCDNARQIVAVVQYVYGNELYEITVGEQ